MTRDPDLIHHFGPAARPGPEEPWRAWTPDRPAIIAGRADWLAGVGLDTAYAQQHHAYAAGYQGEEFDCRCVRGFYGRK